MSNFDFEKKATKVEEPTFEIWGDASYFTSSNTTGEDYGPAYKRLNDILDIVSVIYGDTLSIKVYKYKNRALSKFLLYSVKLELNHVDLYGDAEDLDEREFKRLVSRSLIKTLKEDIYKKDEYIAPGFSLEEIYDIYMNTDSYFNKSKAVSTFVLWDKVDGKIVSRLILEVAQLRDYPDSETGKIIDVSYQDYSYSMVNKHSTSYVKAKDGEWYRVRKNAWDDLFDHYYIEKEFGLNNIETDAIIFEEDNKAPSKINDVSVLEKTRELLSEVIPKEVVGKINPYDFNMRLYSPRTPTGLFNSIKKFSRYAAVRHLFEFFSEDDLYEHTKDILNETVIHTLNNMGDAKEEKLSSLFGFTDGELSIMAQTSRGYENSAAVFVDTLSEMNLYIKKGVSKERITNHFKDIIENSDLRYFNFSTILWDPLIYEVYKKLSALDKQIFVDTLYQKIREVRKDNFLRLDKIRDMLMCIHEKETEDVKERSNELLLYDTKTIVDIIVPENIQIKYNRIMFESF